MIKPRTLAHPPIKEAVLEVLFQFRPSVDVNMLNGYGALVSNRFPSFEDIVNINGTLNNNESSINRVLIGRSYYSPDKKTYIQSRINGFSFAQANQSYTSWDSFKPQGFQELKSFIEFVGPTHILRVSLRFINEFKVRVNESVKDYITIAPNVDPFNLPIRNYVSRVEVDKSDIGAVAVIGQLLSPQIGTESNLYLDIDVIINNPSPLALDINYLSESLDKLRSFKNDIFFSSLTEKTINSFD